MKKTQSRQEIWSRQKDSEQTVVGLDLQTGFESYLYFYVGLHNLRISRLSQITNSRLRRCQSKNTKSCKNAI